MIPTAKIRAFGKLQIWDQNAQPIHLPTKKTKLLLAYLLLTNSQKSRAEIAESVWPESSPENARVSLRTALVALRKALGNDALLTDSESIEINRYAIDCDLFEARRMRKVVEITAEGVERRNFRQQLTDITTHPFCENLSSEMIENERTYWQELRKSTLLQLAEAQLTSGQTELALTTAKQALQMDPCDEEIIITSLKILAALGRPEDAQKLSADTAKNFKKHINSPLPRSIIDLTAEIKSGKYTPFSQNSNLFPEPLERQLLATIVQSGLQKNPDEIFKLICDESFHPMAVHHLKEYLSLLEQCLSATSGNSECRLLAARTASRTAALLNDRAKTLNYANIVITNTEPNNPMHVAMLSFVAYVYVEARQWDDSITYFRRALELAHENNYQYDITSTTLNLAMIRIENLDFDGSIDDILWAINRAKAENLSPFRTATAYIYPISYYMAHGDYTNAHHYADESLSFTNSDPAFFNTASALALRGHALARLGRLRQGLEAAIAALEIGYATGSPSRLQAILENIALILAIAGKPTQGIWLADAVLDSRIAADFPRSKLEHKFLSDENFSEDQLLIAKARSTNRLRQQSSATLVEFAIEECRRTLNKIP